MLVFTDVLRATQDFLGRINQGEGTFKRHFNYEKSELQVQIRCHWKCHDQYYHNDISISPTTQIFLVESSFIFPLPLIDVFHHE